MLAASDAPPEVADQFAAHIVWQDQDPLLPERRYGIRLGNQEAEARVTDLVHRVDPETLEGLAAKTLGPGEVGYCKLALDRAVDFAPYRAAATAGAFEVFEPETGPFAGGLTLSGDYPEVRYPTIRALAEHLESGGGQRPDEAGPREQVGRAKRAAARAQLQRGARRGRGRPRRGRGSRKS